MGRGGREGGREEREGGCERGRREGVKRREGVREKEKGEGEMRVTWVIVKRVLLEFLFVDAAKAVLV